MAVNEQLTNRIREALVDIPNVEEKKMFMGVCFMVDDKMCVCSGKDEMLCRIGPAAMEEAVEKRGCREMIHNGRPMKGFVYVEEQFLQSNEDFNYWINLALEYNKIAEPAKKKKKKAS